MKVLAINGSPRKSGNTASLLESSLDGAREEGALVERIDLIDIRIRPVTEKDYTIAEGAVTGGEPDDLGMIIASLASSDAVIMASPMFFGSITGQMKVMIDRFQFAWLEKNIRHRDIFPLRKKGAFISVQAQDRSDFFQNASSIVRHFFATVNVSCDAELFCGRLEGEHDAADSPEYMDKAFKLGRDIVSSPPGKPWIV